MRFALAVTATASVAFVASLAPFVWPATGDPTEADAVIVLSGDHGERLTRAQDLLDRGVTSTLVLDGALDSAQALQLCQGGAAFEVVCLHPDPDNTREEARAAGRLAASRGWSRVVVATSTHHVARSGLLFRRCLDGEVVMVSGQGPYGGLRQLRAIVREWLAVGYLLTVSRRC